MLLEQLPDPDLHDDWKSFARALLSSLENIAQQAVGTDTVRYISTTVDIGADQLPPYPAGYRPIWLNNADALLYLGNEQFDPPTAPNIVYIDTAKIADAAIATNKLANSAVTTQKLLDDAVTNLKIAADAVGSVEIAAGAVLTTKIADAAIVSAKIGSAAVLTANIQDGAILNAKIADATILGAKIVNGTIGTALISNAAIVTALIGDAQVVQAKIADLAVNEAKIANAAITSAKIGNLAVGAAHIVAASIGTGHINNLAVTNALIADGAINSAKIADATIGTADIGAAQITTALIANLAVGSALIADGAVINAKIGNVIQSSSYDGTNGWQIDKAGNIRGRSIQILDSAGSVIFSTSGAPYGAITGQKPDPQATYSDNLLSNGNFQDGLNGWSVGNLVRSTGLPAPSKYYLAKSGTGHVQVNNYQPSAADPFKIALPPGISDLYVSFEAAAVTGNTSIQLIVTWYGADGVYIPPQETPGWLPVNNGWNLYKHKVTRPANAAFVAVVVYIYDLGDGTNPSYITNLRAAPTELGATYGATIGTNLSGQMTAGNISTFIAGAAIGTALIADAAISTAKIGDLVVNSAKIADLTVGTLKIANSALSEWSITSVLPNQTLTGAWASLTGATVSITTQASATASVQIVEIHAYVELASSSGGGTWWFQCRRGDGTLVGGVERQSAPNSFMTHISCVFYDAAPVLSAANTYTLEGMIGSGNAVVVPVVYMSGKLLKK